ncbi:hypothetical protein LI90_2025 [Carbonactinospora thermoautotrophica]|uniref:Arginine/ornithine antiporter ArcD n=1 Tax=Carbonactinospora thermoautotrophica TaxID=1469144 RepID=A0A132MT02_9ACTN|nr:hypothetical protein [Carbonactinospora thermoautotrophica]KWX00997.1 hypothetical protein LI90_2025 [Carbonactinospora thermoautotrophica]
MNVAEWAALAGLGAFHGLNPGMGWLFAVALALQDRSRAALARALPAIAAGHAASVGIAAAVVTVSGSLLASRVVAVGGGLLLVAFGLWRLLSQRHFRWAGMRLSALQLTGWSFLMSSVHGAGLMLLPVLLSQPGGHPHAGHHHAPGGAEMSATATGITDALLHAGTATVVHTVAMTATAGAVALLVYQVLGLRFLRTAWVNLDLVWAIALIGAGAATVLLS